MCPKVANMRNTAGFTLIEILITLILFGILALTAGLWLVTGTQGYSATRENVTISQKARLAAGRMERELAEITAIDGANCDDDCIVYRVEAVSPFFRALTVRGNELVMRTDPTADCNCANCGGAQTQVLVDQVSAFQVTYTDTAGNSAAAPPGDFSDLALLRIRFDLSRKDGDATIHPFNLAINPRNNLNVNAP